MFLTRSSALPQAIARRSAGPYEGYPLLLDEMHAPKPPWLKGGTQPACFSVSFDDRPRQGLGAVPGPLCVAPRHAVFWGPREEELPNRSSKGVAFKLNNHLEPRNPSITHLVVKFRLTFTALDVT